jgi:antitoxin FitA
MPTLTIKNVPEALYQRLKESAKRERRSMNSEALLCLELALRRVPANTDELLRHIRGVRAATPVRLTEKARRAAVGDGRP